jgi:polygalacturonase
VSELILSGVYNVPIRDMSFNGAMFAVRIKSARGRGGSVHDITVEGLVLENMEMAVAINMHYGSEDPAPPRDERTPDVYDITFKNLTGKNVLNAGTFECLPESACHGLVLEDVHIDSVGGFQCLRAFGDAAGEVTPKPCF